MEKIGRYELRGELGRGGMATVYRAYDPTFRREVAIKLLPREFLHDPTFQARFLHEAQTVAQLEHRAIVPVYDYGEEEGQPYIVMRLMRGGSLADRLDRGPLTFSEAATILQQLAPALDKAHSQRILHRDLKPGNILFDEEGSAHISDFGIAKMLGENQPGLTATGMMAGTPAYMSPEQFRGDPLDGRSDLYALGVIFFQMLTGQLPYRAETPWGVAMKHMGDPIPQLPRTATLPPIAQSLVNHALAKNPAQRYPTAAALAQDASRLASAPPPARPPAPSPYPATPPPHLVAQQPAPRPATPPPPSHVAGPMPTPPPAAPSRSFMGPALIGGGVLMLLLFCCLMAWGSGKLFGGLAATTGPTATPQRSPTAEVALAPTRTPRPPATRTPRPPATATARPAPPTPTNAAPNVAVTEVSAFDLQLGYCFDEFDESNTSTVGVMDCAYPHDNEIFLLVDYQAGPDDPFPGGEAVDTFAQEQCRSGFYEYVGVPYDESDYYVTYYMPSETTWKAGDREVICFLYEKGVKREGSARGTKR